ncbi:mucoidy inhibitor MuiA family protein [candidate division WOR-3 bacterium]|nr:mucoidy inhibitor MuiA family protein [candidate division WOR-3 bacterium]
MKKLIFSALIMFVSFQLYAIKSKITDVTVYRNTALIQRSVIISATQAPSKLEIKKLPYKLNDNSIRITSSSNITVYSYDIKTIYEEDIESEALKNLKIQLEKLERKLSKYDNHIKAISAKRGFLNTMRDALSSNTKTKTSVLDWKSAYKFFSYSIDSLINDSLFTAIKIGDIGERIQVLKNNISQFTSGRNKYKNLIIYIKKKGSNKGSVNINYIINGASWTPYYRLKVLDAEGNYALDYMAKIQQKTGENWNNIKMKVSTSSPEIPSYATHVSPWFLQPYYPVKTKAAYSGKLRAGRVAQESAAPVMKMEDETKDHFATSDVEQSIYSFLFTIPGRLSIPSVDASKTTFISAIEGKGKLSLFASPIMSKYVYAHIDFLNNKKYPFLPGNMDIYWANDYSGKGYMTSVIPKDTASLECGVDKNVNVERELIKRDVRKGGVLSKTDSYYYKYKTTITNRHNRSVELAIEDRIPVSKNKKIKVVNVKISPKGYELDDKGIVEFNLKIPAKTKEYITVEYKIVVPKGMNVGGIY